MRIRFTSAGGLAHLPGLNKPVDIDVDALEPPARDALCGLIEQSRFFDLPAADTGPAAMTMGAADEPVERLTIERSGRSHTVRFGAVQNDPAVTALLAWVRTEVKRVRAAALRGPAP